MVLKKEKANNNYSVHLFSIHDQETLSRLFLMVACRFRGHVFLGPELAGRPQDEIYQVTYA